MPHQWTRQQYEFVPRVHKGPKVRAGRHGATRPHRATAGSITSAGKLDEHTIGFADFNGNRQYISSGNLAENPKAHLFLIDYEVRQRIKLWGSARVVEDDRKLIERLMPADYKAKGEQALLFTVAAWDANCPQHIPQRFEASDVADALKGRDQRIAELEAEIKRLNSVHLRMP